MNMLAEIVITAVLMSNGAEVGNQCFKVVEDSHMEVTKQCEACRSGWAPLEVRCTCEYREVKEGTYHLEKWPDFEPIIKKACGLPVVKTNYVPICRFGEAHVTVGRRNPFVNMGEMLYLRVIETNGVSNVRIGIPEVRANER